MNTQFRQLTTITGILDTPERQPRITLHQTVHEGTTTLQLAGNMLAPLAVPCPDTATQAKVRVIGNPYGIRLIPGTDHNGHRPKQLFPVSTHAGGNPVQNRGLVKRTRPGLRVTTGHRHGSLGNTVHHLPV